MKIKFSSLWLALAGTFLLLSESSCRKADIKTHTADAEQYTASAFFTYSPANIKVKVGYTKGDGSTAQSSSSYSVEGYSTNGDYPGCGDRAYLIDLAYNGFTTLHNTLTDQYTLTFTWTLSVPSGEIEPVTGALTRAYFRFPASPSGSTWQSTTPTFSYVGSHTVDDSGTPVLLYDYTVYYSYTFSSGDYCFNSDFHTYVRFGSDCSEFPFIQMVGTPSYIVDNFAPSTYNVYEYHATNGTDPGLDITFFPLIPTPGSCHPPSLGTTPSHEIRYRLQSSGNPWVIATRTNLFSFSAVVSVGGTYEYQSRGLLLSPSTYTNWSTTKVVSVF
ncbi:MAG: hypothetical protein ABW007_13040 [Chitinophagaceae bacterium]